MKNRSCVECGTQFNYTRKTAKYCSPRCKQVAYRRSLSSTSVQSLADHVYFSHVDTTLYQGDCVELLPRLSEKPDLILTSPPYDQLRQYGGHPWDFAKTAGSIVATMPKGGVLVWIVSDATVDYSETGSSFRQALDFMDLGLKLHDTMIFEFSNTVGWSSERYDQSFHYMFVFSKGRPAVANLIRDKQNVTSGRRYAKRTSKGRKADRRVEYGYEPYVVQPVGLRGNIWRYAVGLHHSAPDFTSAHEHPAIFPLALARDHIRTWTDEGGLVLDPMAGSGTTLRAAADLQRRSIGIEIHQPYCDLIQRRMSQQALNIAV